MKRLYIALMCLTAMMVAGTSAKAQVTVTLRPGWTWIGSPTAEVVPLSEAFSGITPQAGDMVKAQQGIAYYLGSGNWFGMTELQPGLGYKYYSKNTGLVDLTFGASYTPGEVMVTLKPGWTWFSIPYDIPVTLSEAFSSITPQAGDMVKAQSGIAYYLGGGNWFGMTELQPGMGYKYFSVNTEPVTLTFSTNPGQVWPNGILPGAFSINATQQVHFSQGNLQYRASTDTWRFAGNQYDYIGADNTNISSTYNGWIDLFGWGTSGYDHGAVCYQPWSTSTTNSDYDVYGSYMNNLEDQTGKADWGYNAISNGGNSEDLWRTLQGSEWQYLFNTRSTSSGIRYAKAQVNGVNGVILLPDNWSASTYSLNNTNNDSAEYTGNVIGKTDWTDILEPNGAVFFPAAGNRNGTSVYSYSSDYWSSTRAGVYNAVDLDFSPGYLNSFYTGTYKYYGCSVRLVYKVDATMPVISTRPVNEVTETTAHCGGHVTFDGGSALTAYGVCWSTHENPTLSDWHTIDNNISLGWFDSNLTGLTPGTTYYVRAYATNSEGTAYGIQVAFTTHSLTTLPTVITNPVINIAQNSAMCGGTVTDDGGAEVTARGVCWSTSQNPTISGSHTDDGSGVGSFTSVLSVLTPGTTYYVRAYATNSKGTAYGEELSFTTIPTGAIYGLFSVSDTRKVCFSKGNLQYKASTNTWRFAEHQYDYVGSDNSHISSSYSGWIDLFGWGTSGYNHGAVCYQPWSTSTTDSDYYPYGDADYDLNDQTGKADWGYNAISNGGNMEHIWRTLTQQEWYYVFENRSTQSGIRYAKAKVNGKNGVILLPDNWSSTIYQLNNTNDSDVSYSCNNINQTDWDTLLEANGAVFMPAAGLYNGQGIYWVGSRGCYWSTTSNHDPSFYVVRDLDFNDDRLNPAVNYTGLIASWRASVRLVCTILE